MDAAAFESTFESIVQLNGSEGPSRNIFEPKFKAREQMLILCESIKNCLRDQVTHTAVSQLLRCSLLIAHNLHETEEDADAMTQVLQAFAVLRAAISDRDKLCNVATIPPSTLEEVLRSELPIVSFDPDFALVPESVEILNAIGLFLSNGTSKLRLQDAVAVLRMAEKIIEQWMILSEGKVPRICNIPLQDDGQLDKARCADGKGCEFGLRMHHCETSTCYYLAQAYAATHNVRESSKYCHRTMINQLLNKKEFSKRDWATNALQLSSFYLSERDYEKALHCLRAAEFVMPKDKPSEENVGMVAWAFGKFSIARLKNYASHPAEEILPDPARKDAWWQPFPVPVVDCSVQPITSFEEAREEFKEGKRWFDTALTYYVMDGCCTDHIAILQDVGSLYKYLSEFEPNLERKVAMLQRRVDLIESIPASLSFQAYATLIRQLLFDLGDMYTEIVDLRTSQKKEKSDLLGKPISDSRFNELCIKAQSFFQRFVDTFKDPKTAVMPTTLEKDLRVPVFRALMRSAQLESRRFHKTPKEDYDTVGRTITRYEDAISFAKNNPMDDSVAVELKLAQDMLQLLPGKQRELWRVYNRT